MNTQNTQTKNAQHTPGPWRTGDAGLTVFGPKTDEPAPVTIALLPNPSPRVSPDERRANARLIAAAPDLLAALYVALPFVMDAEDDPTFKPGYVAGRIKEIRAAIARAEGGAS